MVGRGTGRAPLRGGMPRVAPRDAGEAWRNLPQADIDNIWEPSSARYHRDFADLPADRRPRNPPIRPPWDAPAPPESPESDDGVASNTPPTDNRNETSGRAQGGIDKGKKRAHPGKPDGDDDDPSESSPGSEGDNPAPIPSPVIPEKVQPIVKAIDDMISEPKRWKFQWMSREGANSTAALFVRVDDGGYIRDRMFVKHILGDEAGSIVDVLDRPEPGEAASPPPRPGTWTAYTRVKLLQVKDAPSEIVVHYLQSEVYGNSNVPTFRTAARRAGGTTSRWIVYMEYAPFGSLEEIITHYGGLEYGLIPEIFIWYVAESLASACKSLIWGDDPPSDVDLVRSSDMSENSDEDETGARNNRSKKKGKAKSKNRATIDDDSSDDDSSDDVSSDDVSSDEAPPRYVHTDIKPENILLGEAQNGYYSVYKHPLLADLGDLAVSGERHIVDTPGYCAPVSA
ncbi:hypothetical protein BU16DRAFT_543141 [Lophium mytilinum]|uniref:Protein kinase domain-containing protein n=1 Tax=Lophium mytilinum TaxID=390894 RepID=A0A6A6QEY4_9PEZI|nr:hypothetical protein BU16DRAFT_543141 [Lophium mytilinum]